MYENIFLFAIHIDMPDRKVTRSATKTYKRLIGGLAKTGKRAFVQPVTRLATKVTKPLHRVPIAGGLVKGAVRVPSKLYKGVSNVVVGAPRAMGRVGGVTRNLILSVVSTPFALTGVDPRGVVGISKRKAIKAKRKAGSKSRR